MNTILVCPCCASPVDAQPHSRPQNFECEVCEQKWTMVVDHKRTSEHSLT